jgi:hypothetical protein
MYVNVDISTTYERSQQSQILKELTVYVIVSDSGQCQYIRLFVQDKGLFLIYRN